MSMNPFLDVFDILLYYYYFSTLLRTLQNLHLLLGLPSVFTIGDVQLLQLFFVERPLLLSFFYLPL